MSQKPNPTVEELSPERAAIAQCLLIAYRRGLQLRTQQKAIDIERVAVSCSPLQSWEATHAILDAPHVLAEA